jgi:hypothetical protein
VNKLLTTLIKIYRLWVSAGEEINILRTLFNVNYQVLDNNCIRACKLNIYCELLKLVSAFSNVEIIIVKYGYFQIIANVFFALHSAHTRYSSSTLFNDDRPTQIINYFEI